MSNIKITVEYDGTNYCGWQRQKNTSRTIQQKIEDCLTKLNKQKVKVEGAGRTDSGVHALGQVANFHLDVSIPVRKIPRALNSMLPDDIICKNAERVSDKFHSSFCATGKKYRYRILNRSFSSVFLRNFVYTIYKPVNFVKIKKVINKFEGTHDFSAFQSSNSEVSSPVRTIKNIVLKEKSPEHWIEITGDGFLYNMVRIIVGTLLEIGLDKRKSKITKILESSDRQKAGFTAPAKGLTLVKVFY